MKPLNLAKSYFPKGFQCCLKHWALQKHTFPKEFQWFWSLGSFSEHSAFDPAHSQQIIKSTTRFSIQSTPHNSNIQKYKKRKSNIETLKFFPNRSLFIRVLMVAQKKGKERKRDRKRAWADCPETSRRDLANFFGLGRLSRDPAPRCGQLPLRFLLRFL